MNQKTYAGIGARRTPVDILRTMTGIAKQLSSEGFTLRSGAAHGADSAFELGAGSNKEIYLPWPRFNEHDSPFSNQLPEAFRIAEKFHPNWSNLSGPVRKLMARNAHQILGPWLDDPAMFVLCWTPDGKGGGGTGQAIRLAKACDVPVFDMGSLSLNEIEKELNSLLLQTRP